MEENTKNNAFQFVITLCHYRIENMENTLGKHLIEKAINNKNLSDEEIKIYLSSKSLNKMDLINKINNELYNNNSQQTSIEKIQKILDNARIHHAKIVEKVCEILNINLIFLQPYCPDLNPIEDVWRIIKSKLYKSIYENLNELIEIFKEKYYQIVDSKSFYEKWVDEYLGTNIW